MNKFYAIYHLEKGLFVILDTVVRTFSFLIMSVIWTKPIRKEFLRATKQTAVT